MFKLSYNDNTIQDVNDQVIQRKMGKGPQSLSENKFIFKYFTVSRYLQHSFVFKLSITINTIQSVIEQEV